MGMGLTVWKMSNKSNAAKPFKILFSRYKKYSIKLHKPLVEFRKFMDHHVDRRKQMLSQIELLQTSELQTDFTFSSIYNHYLITFLELSLLFEFI